MNPNMPSDAPEQPQSFIEEFDPAFRKWIAIRAEASELHRDFRNAGPWSQPWTAKVAEVDSSYMELIAIIRKWILASTVDSDERRRILYDLRQKFKDYAWPERQWSTERYPGTFEGLLVDLCLTFEQ